MKQLIGTIWHGGDSKWAVYQVETRNDAGIDLKND